MRRFSLPPLSTTTEANRGLGLAACIVAAAGWGFAGVLADLTTTSPALLTFYRMAIAAVLFSAGGLITGRRIGLRALRVGALGGILLTADLAMFFEAVRLTSVAVASVIGALQPVLVLILAGPVLGERVGRARALLTVVAVAAVGLVAAGPARSGHHAVIGDLLAVGSLVAWSGYFLVSKRARAGVDAFSYTWGATIVGSVAALVPVLATGGHFTAVRAGDWRWIVLLAVVPGFAHLSMNWAHRHLDASVSSIVISANPLVAAAGAYLFLGQSLTSRQIAAGVVGLVAISIAALPWTQGRRTAKSEGYPAA